MDKLKINNGPRRLQAGTMALVSSLVMVSGVIYVAAPAADAVEFSVSAVGPAKCSASKIGSTRAFTIYGKVAAANGVGIGGAKVVVKISPNLKNAIAAGNTAKSGAFTIPVRTSRWVKGKPGKVVIEISGGGAKGSTTFPVTCPKGIKVSAKIVKKPVITFLPISTY